MGKRSPKTQSAVEDPKRHPALSAWREVCPDGPTPVSIEVLKPEKSKAAVYRLRMTNKTGASVIAKRYSAAAAGNRDVHIYEEFLPAVSLPTLKVYGFLQSHEGFSWLFIEDAGEGWYSPTDSEHRWLAVEWLARLHSRAHGMQVNLPNRGPEYFESVLAEALTGVIASTEHRALEEEDRQVLHGIRGYLEVVSEEWMAVVSACKSLPFTVAHGDFVPKNIRVRLRGSRFELLVFDWETAGVASPGVDLARIPGGHAGLVDYWTQVRLEWPEVGVSDVMRVQEVGRLFRLLHAVSWALRSFRHPWVRKAMRRMRSYEEYLDALVPRRPWI